MGDGPARAHRSPEHNPSPNLPPVSQPTREQVLDILRQIQDPDLHRDIVSLGFITKAEFSGECLSSLLA